MQRSQFPAAASHGRLLVHLTPITGVLGQRSVIPSIRELAAGIQIIRKQAITPAAQQRVRRQKPAQPVTARMVPSTAATTAGAPGPIPTTQRTQEHVQGVPATQKPDLTPAVLQLVQQQKLAQRVIMLTDHLSDTAGALGRRSVIPSTRELAEEIQPTPKPQTTRGQRTQLQPI